jgi:predicted ATPase
VLRQKVERLGEDDRRLLEAASVEGEQFSAALVARIAAGSAGLEDDEAGIEERLRDLAVRHRLIEPAGEVEYPDGTASHRFRFAHSLYQHAFYDDLTPKRREALHRRAGEELERCSQGPQAAPCRWRSTEKGREFWRAIETPRRRRVAGWRNPDDARPHL